MDDTFARLAADFGLQDRIRQSPEALIERYLYSSDMVFRYAFGRWWGEPDIATSAMWVLLNPTTGDTEKRHRPTLERCISRSKAAGCTGLVIVNLFAFRDTDPRNLRTVADPVGPANDEVLRVLTAAGTQTIAAWGGHGRLGGRSTHVGALLDSPLCLGSPVEASRVIRCTFPATLRSSLGDRCVPSPSRTPRSRDAGGETGRRRACSRHRPAASRRGRDQALGPIVVLHFHR